MKVLIINGSHRKGNTDLLLNQLILEIELLGFNVRQIFLRDHEINLPDGCAFCARAEVCPSMHDEFSSTVEPSLRGYDVYIIATPTWDDGVTPLTKIFWDRIVSWSHDDRKYLRDKKIALVTHGMAGVESSNHLVNWVKSVCIWEHAKYAGSLVLTSGAEVGDILMDKSKLDNFVQDMFKS
ncbi:MAG: flavodoxin family protein [Minisyncoccia bacterium]